MDNVTVVSFMNADDELGDTVVEPLWEVSELPSVSVLFILLVDCKAVSEMVCNVTVGCNTTLPFVKVVEDTLFSVFKALDDMNWVNITVEVDDNSFIVGELVVTDASVVCTLFTCEQVTMKVK